MRVWVEHTYENVERWCGIIKEVNAPVGIIKNPLRGHGLIVSATRYVRGPWLYFENLYHRVPVRYRPKEGEWREWHRELLIFLLNQDECKWHREMMQGYKDEGMMVDFQTSLFK